MGEKETMKTDLPSKIFSRIAYKLHPKLGEFYDSHPRFFNDGIVELVCLLIANGFTWFFSYHFVGFSLAAMLTLTSTPITYCIKYLLHKYWVWKYDY